MNPRHCYLPRLAVTALALGAAATAQSFSYPDFQAPQQLTLVGNATLAAGNLRLCANAPNQTGLAWRQTPVSLQFGFTTSFTFRILPSTAGTPGQGLAFVLHSDPAGNAAIGGTAWGLGYGRGANGAAGIQQSLAIELDTYRDLFLADTSANELSIHTRGPNGNDENEALSIGRATPAQSLADGALHTISIRYVPGLLEVFVDGAPAPAIARPWSHLTGGNFLTGSAVPPPNFPGQLATVGFTATTGPGALTQLTEILSWQWQSNSPLDPCFAGTLPGDVLTVDGRSGDLLRTVRLATWQPFAIEMAAIPSHGPNAPYALFLSLAAQPGAPGSALGFGNACFPVLPTGATELVLADTFGLFPALLPAAPAPHTIALPIGTVTGSLDCVLQAIVLADANPFTPAISNAVRLEFRPAGAPTVTSIAPLSAVPGQPITVIGTGFLPGAAIEVQGIPIAPTTATATQLVFAYPTNAPCSAALRVINPDSQFAVAVLNPQPVISGTILGSGTAAGNQFFFLQGTGFAPGTAVTIGGAPAPVQSATATLITVRTPPGVPGVAPVLVTTPGGCTASTTYTYL
ncbi:MAG: IPT/TIG domain-containing protein [Planctomycetes bacterium]|jgi:hypothetical protein|nr:IPT/TIG domain-containing protein [Planctomycetota bacterium]